MKEPDMLARDSKLSQSFYAKGVAPGLTDTPVVMLIGPRQCVHQHGQAFGHSREFPKQLPSLGCIMGIARRQSEGYGRSSIRGTHMNLGVPSAPALAHTLWPLFFAAPGP